MGDLIHAGCHQCAGCGRKYTYKDLPEGAFFAPNPADIGRRIPQLSTRIVCECGKLIGYQLPRCDYGF